MSNKRPKSDDGTAMNAIAPSWEEMLPKIRLMSKEQIVACLGKSWDADPSGIRSDVAAAAERADGDERKRKRTTWVRVERQADMLDFDWATEGGDMTMSFKSEMHEAAGDEDDEHWTSIAGYQFRMDVVIEELRDMLLTTGDGDLKLEAEGEEEECGCVECGAPGSFLILRLERKGVEHRLIATSHIMCCCNTEYGQPEDLGGGTEVYYPVKMNGDQP